MAAAPTCLGMGALKYFQGNLEILEIISLKNFYEEVLRASSPEGNDLKDSFHSERVVTLLKHPLKYPSSQTCPLKSRHLSKEVELNCLYS